MKARLDFSKSELIHLRRFVNRAVACANGECFHRIYADYYAYPLLKKIDKAFKRITNK